MTREQKQQFTLRITQANETELVVILYDMILCYLKESGEAHAGGSRNGFRDGIRKIRGCFNELMHSLHLEYEPAPTLMQLYLFCIRRLAYSEVRNDAEALAVIEKVVTELRDAYAQVAHENQNGPVMKNVQTVYAGLTYGRNTLTENMADQGSDRGMRV